MKFAGVAATIPSDTATKIVVVSPAGAKGTVDVTVTTAGGTSATTLADRFTYYVWPTPTVTALDPTTGSTAGGTTVTITGTNLTGATAVISAASGHDSQRHGHADRGHSPAGVAVPWM